MSYKVDAYLAALPDWQAAALRTVRAEAQAAGLSEDFKWGHPMWSSADGAVCLLKGFKTHMNLGFWRGAQMTALDARLAPLGGKAWVVVAKAVVTQASSAIPVVPLYISILFDVMKSRGTHEDCIDQILRLFRDRLGAPVGPATDPEGRIRLDDLELDPVVQAEVVRRWQRVTTGNLDEHTGEGILELLYTLNAERRVTLVVVTHDDGIAGRAARWIHLHEGRAVVKK